MRNFRNYNVWKNGIELSSIIYEVTRAFPKHELYGISSQIQRAATSIPSNVAEGASRKSEKEFKRFVEISLGSAFELETQLIISRNIGYLDVSTLNNLLERIEIVQKQLSRLYLSL